MQARKKRTQEDDAGGFSSVMGSLLGGGGGGGGGDGGVSASRSKDAFPLQTLMESFGVAPTLAQQAGASGGSVGGASPWGSLMQAMSGSSGPQHPGGSQLDGALGGMAAAQGMGQLGTAASALLGSL